MPIAKTVKLSTKGQIVIPQEIREKLQVRPGDRLVLLFRDGETVLLTPAEYARHTRGLLRGLWGHEKEAIDAFLQKEREAWE